MQAFLDKIRQYLLHFIISALIIFIGWGFLRYRDETSRLNNQLYLASKTSGLVFSKPAKKPLIDKILDRKVLVPPPSIPPDRIEKVVEIKTSSNCPPATITFLRDGSAVSNSSGVTSIVIEEYSRQSKLGVRLAYVVYPRTASYPFSWDVGVHLHYWKAFRLQPDLTLATSSVGVGLSYNPRMWVLNNTYFGVGYAYKFREHRRTVYGSASVKF